ncbi:hypothetical protein J1N35_019951 [Gossypium stocksii]|uniref:Uncharacterized protein n=1 Tax=Gossypium stocksii TaxID=47602 RepID=A0A9D3VC18_9ROSI|nr:hypothetical protein J1N35_019951 [Gossypium stocksii]
MEIAKKGKWRLRVGNEAINKIWRSQKKRNQVKELEMLHRGMDWLWVVVEGEENSDYTQIKTANRRVTYLMYMWLSAFAKHGFPFISNRDSILFDSGCAGISIALLDRTVSWPWNVRGSSIIIRIRTISWFSHARVNAKIKAEIKEWQDKKQKKVSSVKLFAMVMFSVAMN